MEQTSVVKSNPEITAPSKKEYEKCTTCGYILNVHEGVQDEDGSWFCEVCKPY